MGWTIRIRHADGRSLGPIEALRELVTKSLPGIQFYREPSGKEKLAAYNIDFPDVIRKHLEGAPAEIRADWEVEDLFLRFFFGPEHLTEIDAFSVEVRGDGNPIPFVSGLCSPNAWVAEGPDGAELDLTAATSPEWEGFKAWRDRAIEQSGQRGAADGSEGT